MHLCMTVDGDESSRISWRDGTDDLPDRCPWRTEPAVSAGVRRDDPVDTRWPDNHHRAGDRPGTSARFAEPDRRPRPRAHQRQPHPRARVTDTGRSDWKVTDGRPHDPAGNEADATAHIASSGAAPAAVGHAPGRDRAAADTGVGPGRGGQDHAAHLLEL